MEIIIYIGSVYIVICLCGCGGTYIGSTTLSLEERMNYHFDSSLKCNNKFHKHIREAGKSMFTIKLLETVKYYHIDELRMKEREYYEVLQPSLNDKIPFLLEEELPIKKRMYNQECKESRLKVGKEWSERNKNHTKKYREENKEKIKNRKQEYHKINKDIIKQKKHENYLKKKEEINAKNKIRYAKNKDKYKITSKIKYEKNKEKISLAQKIYYEKNKDKIKPKRLETMKKTKT